VENNTLFKEISMRPYRQLQYDERIVIKKMLYTHKMSIREIAKDLGRHPSTISREIKRNSTHGYNEHEAQKKAEGRRKVAKERKCQKNEGLAMEIETLLIKNKYSPEIIAVMLKKKYPHNSMMHISHETIYQEIYRRYHREGRKDLVEALFFKRKKRQRRSNMTKSRIIDYTKKNIRQRSEEANMRKEVGHLEGDLIESAHKNAYLLTLVDRCSNYTWALLLPSKDADTVMRGIIEIVSEMPKGFVKTITLDNGTEFAHHKKLEEILQCTIYFADPYSPWQRGINENINRIYRFFLPKKKSFAHLTDEEIDDISEQINKRPRKSKGWKSPYEVLHEHLTVALQT